MTIVVLGWKQCKVKQLLEWSFEFFRQCRLGVLLHAGCSKTSKNRVRLHVFPADPKYGRLWAAKVRLTRAIVVRSDVFFSAAQRTFRAVVLRIRSTPHIWHEEKSYYKTWRHPNNFSRVGSQRRYLKDVTNLEERMPNVKSSCKFELWGHVFSLRVTVQGNPSGPSAQQP